MESIPVVEVKHIYICAKCKQCYDTEEDALNCYNSHPIASEIIDQKYYGSGIPDAIVVKFDTGGIATYRI